MSLLHRLNCFSPLSKVHISINDVYIHCTHTKYTRMLIWIEYHKWQILSRFLYTSLYDYTILMMSFNRVKTASSNHIVYMQIWFSVGRVFFFHLFNISFHPLHFIIDLMSASCSKDFWFSLYILPILVPYNLWCSYITIAWPI